ncbi:MAG TPA: hypothetical protein DCE76_00300 [Anaerolineaceae bacterium]|nr:hypothetical protein [Anaerolineaceae bacterium]
MWRLEMDFLEDLFENFFDRRNRRNTRGGHKTGSDHHDRQGIPYERSSVCTRCGLDNPIENKYCLACGSDLTPETENVQGIFCEGCGARNQIGSKFCQACGLNLMNTTTTCQSCRSTVPPNAKFCPQCGQTLAGTKIA